MTRRPHICSSVQSNLVGLTLEANSHADTWILNDFDRPGTVYGYDPAFGLQVFCTVLELMAYYDHPQMGETFHLVIHQAIETPHLHHNLLCPMQCRVNGVTINGMPIFFV